MTGIADESAPRRARPANCVPGAAKVGRLSRISRKTSVKHGCYGDGRWSWAREAPEGLSSLPGISSKSNSIMGEAGKIGADHMPTSTFGSGRLSESFNPPTLGDGAEVAGQLTTESQSDMP